jgi:pyridoxal phosphate enzyme (YggS family)
MIMNSIDFRLNLIRKRMAAACIGSQRPPEQVTLLGVSKSRSLEEIRQAYAAGLRCFGENRWQEAQPKLEALADLNIEWHFIGRLQSNKTKHIAQHFSWVHSVVNEKIAERLNQHANHGAPLNVCIQINIDDDPNKAGIEPAQAIELAAIIDALPNLTLRGLMTVPKKHQSLTQDQQSYQRMSVLFNELQQAGHKLDTLSMGMSRDFEAAISEGATLVRVGKNLFGPLENTDSPTNELLAEHSSYLNQSTTG